MIKKLGMHISVYVKWNKGRHTLNYLGYGSHINGKIIQTNHGNLKLVSVFY